MIVWLLHGCRLEAMCHLVQIIRDANVPVAKKKWHRNWRTVHLLMRSIWKVLTLRCTESLSTSSVLNCKLYQAPSNRLWTRGWPRLCARSSAGRESVFTCHHTEDTNCWCCFFMFVFFLFLFLTILYRRSNTTTEWRSLSKCDVFQCRQFPHAGSCVIFALHISPCISSEQSAPLAKAGFSNRIAISWRDLHGNEY